MSAGQLFRVSLEVAVLKPGQGYQRFHIHRVRIVTADEVQYLSDLQPVHNADFLKHRPGLVTDGLVLGGFAEHFDLTFRWLK
ncbi:hypothetical protein D3C73_1180970 [compost metagenome]